MPLISRRGRDTNWQRTTGLYGHTPKWYAKSWKEYLHKCSSPGYVRIITKKHMYTVFYHGNRFRPGSIFEKGKTWAYFDRDKVIVNEKW